MTVTFFSKQCTLHKPSWEGSLSKLSSMYMQNIKKYDTCLSGGNSHNDWLVILLKRYGLPSLLLQNFLHPACSNSTGRSWTGSAGFPNEGIGLTPTPGGLPMPAGGLPNTGVPTVGDPKGIALPSDARVIFVCTLNEAFEPADGTPWVFSPFVVTQFISAFSAIFGSKITQVSYNFEQSCDTLFLRWVTAFYSWTLLGVQFCSKCHIYRFVVESNCQEPLTNFNYNIFVQLKHENFLCFFKIWHFGTWQASESCM